MGPSATDVEFRSLSPDGGGSVDLMRHMMDFLICVFESRKDFELGQGYLALFLKLYTDEISSDSVLLEKAQELQKSQLSAWDHVRTKLNQSLCLVTYLRGAVL